MISYAQNFEDVILWRCLKNVKNGFYIDVGANDPVTDSVTKWFYEQGWHGINMEPSEDYYNRVVADRKRDVNLCLGAGAKETDVTFYEISGTGLSTTSTEIMEQHKKNGWPINKKTIKIVPLSDVCRKYVKNQTVHFMKIDVEGGGDRCGPRHGFRKLSAMGRCNRGVLGFAG